MAGLFGGSDSGQERLTIESYKKIDLTGGAENTFIAQTNPQQIEYTFAIDSGGGEEGSGGSKNGMTTSSAGRGATGKSAAPPIFKGYTQMSLDFLIKADATGILPVPKGMEKYFGTDKKPTIKPYLDLLQNTVYTFQKDSHGPPYLKLIWGNVFPDTSNQDQEKKPAIYKGQIESYKVTIKLFSLTGEPIKADINLKIKSLIAPDAKPLGNSPDLTHNITIGHSDKMTTHCQRIYGRHDTKICAAIAEYNSLPDWNLQRLAGQQMIFPSIHLLEKEYLHSYEYAKTESFFDKTEEQQIEQLVGRRKAKQYFKLFPNKKFES